MSRATRTQWAWIRAMTLGSVIAMAAGMPVATATAEQAGSKVAVYLTTRNLDTTLAPQPELEFVEASGPTGERIDVDPAVTGQTLTAGFGVAMTETSAYLLRDELPESLREKVVRALFSPTEGIGLSFLRIPIGATDYVVGELATPDDQPPGGADPELRDFSIDRDMQYAIPEIREALTVNPGMTVMANPWTPPAWMKTDDALVTTSGPLGHLKPEYYGAYARYLVKFIQAYRDQGIEINYLGVQNEPTTPLAFVVGIPESYLDPIQQGILIRDHLSPALAAAGLSTSVLTYDDGFQRSEVYIPAVMSVARPQTAGFAYHCYLTDPSSIGIQHRVYPEMTQLVTECSSKLSNVDPQQMMIRALRAGANGIQLWNAVLDQNNGPKMGNGCRGIVGEYAGQDCIAPVTVNTDTHDYTFTSDYWALAHFSKFIRPGAKQIASTSPSSCLTTPVSGSMCGLEGVAFENPDRSRVLVVTANDGADHTFTLAESRRRVTYTLRAGATATLVWQPTS
ncbi:glycoside hydrolase family 30 beta sandwich domain-containing protein [Nocardia sp. NPDC059246]|uniref:glycoside hydrolase family 30 protein n=1 Tax=unclassified Nocardia TaxID=2637762 RepID=UPI0036C96B01